MNNNIPINLFENASIMEEVGSVTYIGYLSPQASTLTDVQKKAGAYWAIRRIETTGGTTEIKYPSGSRKHGFIWNNRAALTYSFLKTE